VCMSAILTARNSSDCRRRCKTHGWRSVELASVSGARCGVVTLVDVETVDVCRFVCSFSRAFIFV